MYLQGRRVSEEEWVQLEGAASCAKVLKVEVNVDRRDRCARALAAGLVKNKVLQKVELTVVPKEAKKSVIQILQLNPDLTVVVREPINFFDPYITISATLE